MKTIERPRLKARARAGFAARLAGLAAALLPVVPLEAPPTLRPQAEALTLSNLTVAVAVARLAPEAARPAADPGPRAAGADEAVAARPPTPVRESLTSVGQGRVTLQAGAVKVAEE